MAVQNPERLLEGYEDRARRSGSLEVAVPFKRQNDFLLAVDAILAVRYKFREPFIPRRNIVRWQHLNFKIGVRLDID